MPANFTSVSLQSSRTPVWGDSFAPAASISAYDGITFVYEAPRRHRRSRMPLASITDRVQGRDTSHCDREKRMRWLFRHISNGGSRLTEADLMRFSVKHGLPTEYVRPFFEAMARSGGPATAYSSSIPLEVFSRYVRSREEALQRVFNTLDKDGDGLVTPAQLRAGLHHITFQCPNSRYTYRTCTDKCARALTSMDFPMCPTQRETPNITFCKFRHFFMLLPHDSMMMEYWAKMGDPACVDVGDRIRFQDGRKGPATEASSWGHLLAGAFAGAVSRTATAPLETVRLMAMTGTLGGGSSVVASVASVVQRQGWRALYRGNGANVVRSAPQKALDFFAFDAFKNCLSGGGAGGASRGGPVPHQPSAAHTFVAAGLAGAVSNALLYPLEVVRCRLTTDTTGAYKSIGHAAATIARSEGPFALYRGLLPSVAAILPEAAITYGLFDLLKRSYASMSGEEPGVAASLAFGVVSAFSGQLVAYPLETISRRMQVMTHGNAITAAADVWNSGGPGALYKGLAAACIRLIPMAMISFGTYEFVRTQITKLEVEWDRMETTRELQDAHLTSHALATSV